MVSSGMHNDLRSFLYDDKKQTTLFLPASGFSLVITAKFSPFRAGVPGPSFTRVEMFQ